MTIELDEKELENLLTEVQGVVAAAASEDLAKSEKEEAKEEKEEAKDVEKCGEMLPVKKEEEKPEAKEEPKKEEAEEKPEAKEEPKEEAKQEVEKNDEPPAEEKPAEEPAPEAPAEEPEQDLDAKLSALDDDKLKHLYMACKKALFSRMASQEQPAQEPAPEAPAAAPEAPVAKAEEAAEEKEEEKDEPKEMKKSEEASELQLQNELLQKALTLLATPLRKGITGISQVAPVKEEVDVTKLSKAEVIEKLNEKAFQPDLKKSDRELINGYCLGLVSLEKITHLLK